MYQQQDDNNTASSSNTAAVEKEEAISTDTNGENDENDDEEEDSPMQSQNQDSAEPTINTPTVDTTFNETNDAQPIKSNYTTESTTTQTGNDDSPVDKKLDQEGTTVLNLQRNDPTANQNASNVNDAGNNVSQAIVDSKNGSINNATEKPLSPTLEQASNVTSADFTTGGVAESTSRDTKFDESIQSGSSAFVEKIMKQEKIQQHNEDNGLLARSGLLFDDENHLSENTNKESGVTDANVEDDENSIVPTTGLPSLGFKVANDDNNSDDVYTTDSPVIGDESELETFTTSSPNILKESH